MSMGFSNESSGSGITPFQSIQDVQGGETLRWTADPAAGLTRIQLVADAGNAGVLSYEKAAYH